MKLLGWLPVDRQQPTRTDPTDKELTEWADALLAEIDGALSADAWALIDRASDHRIHRLYDAASLRHCATLLRRSKPWQRPAKELATRVLIRTHIEAFLFALYIHFGGIDAVTKIAQDTLSSLAATHNNDFAGVGRMGGKGERCARRKPATRSRRNNEANSGNGTPAHPEEPPRPHLRGEFVRTAAFYDWRRPQRRDHLNFRRA